MNIRFGRTEISVNESVGKFMMCVLKNPDTIVPMTVDIQLVQGSASREVSWKLHSLSLHSPVAAVHS